MSGHFYFSLFPLFSTFMIVAGALSRCYPRFQRPLDVAAGLLLIAGGIAMLTFFPGQVAAAWMGWAIIVCGAMIGLGAALNWLPVTEDDAPVRPATNRPLRHFGEHS